MDLAYDHIQEEIYVSRDNDEKRDDNAPDSEKPDDQSSERPLLNLSEEFQETFREFSDSAWGSRLGGLWGNVRRHGESYYKEAREEYNVASEEAIKGFTGLKDNLIQHTRGLSLVGELTGANDRGKDAEGEAKPGKDEGEASNTVKERSTPQNGNGNGGEEGEGFIARFKAEAAKRLKDIQKAEDAADEALLKFGTNVADFLRDAVSVAPPDAVSSEGPSDKVLFESKGADGKRVIHTTRFDAQLHAIHTNLESFSKDPVGDEWSKWHNEFQVDKKTDDISNDLGAYPELRKAMEALVPEKVEYADFWNRYYFLRMVIETEEKKRKELLKASADDEEEVGWDEESESEQESAATPQVKKQDLGASVSTLAPSTAVGKEPCKSNDQQSQADSDASYDIVSGATSRAPGSPKEKKSPPTPSKIEESDEDDWE